MRRNLYDGIQFSTKWDNEDICLHYYELRAYLSTTCIFNSSPEEKLFIYIKYIHGDELSLEIKKRW